MKIPDKYRDLFLSKNVAHLATINPDGSPQVTPVWIDLEDDTIRINTAKGRKKARNLSVGSKVAISIPDREDPYRYVAIQGEVIDITTDGALEHIIQLSHRYFGIDFKRVDGEIRIIISIKANHIYPE